jgi:uncharacterized protein YPO0396
VTETPDTTNLTQLAHRVTRDLADTGASEPQWRLESLQMVNWGGFEGHHTVTYHAESTLVSGGSGTGKSTMLDAYTALMMSSKVPFNGASNDAGSGRARDEAGGQRTLLTYLRGKVGNTDEGGGNKSANLLRGKGRSTWGAVAGTFVNTDGTAFTAARVYYLPATASDVASIAQHMLTCEGRLDLAVLGPVMSQFVPSSQQLGKVLTSAVYGLTRHDTYDKFSTALFSKLAIGANGDGEKALELLARIQASKAVKSVNDLYRDLVLDTPATFTDADRAIAHFDNLEDAYRQMETAANKVAVLRDIPEIHDRLVAASRDAEELDTFGLTRHGETTPITVWRLHTEFRLLDTAIADVHESKRRNSDTLRTATEMTNGLKTQLSGARAEYNKQGGADLESVTAQIQTADGVRDDREDARSRLALTAEVLNPVLDTRADFDRLHAAAAAFLEDQATWEAAEEEARNGTLRRRFVLQDRKRVIDDELRSLSSRKGRIHKHLDDLRADVANASGIPAGELPFLAELIDIAEGENSWRLAIETVLSGDARRLLVPASRLSAFSSAIDRLRLRGRITFAAAEPDLPIRFSLTGADDLDQRSRVAGKLTYADHPYAGWIQRRLTRPSRNALCVETADGLSGDGFRVTLAGQTRNGTEGAHGRNEAHYVIGFSNTSLIEEYGAENDRILGELDGVDSELRELGHRAAERGKLRDAYLAVRQYTWDQIDVAGALARVQELAERRKRIKNSNDDLAELDELVKELDKAYEDAVGQKRLLEDKKTTLEARHGDLVDRQDDVRRDLDAVEADQRVVLTEDQSVRLDTDFKQAVEPGDPGSLDDFEVNLGHLNKRLLEAVGRAKAEAQRSEADLVKAFGHYKNKWDDPNLGTAVESYPDYKRILDEIQAGGLGERQEKWQRKLTEWSGQDLLPLTTSLRNAISDIEDRITPINDILAGLPFGARGGHLQIRVTRLRSVPVQQFLTRLKKLSSTATADMDFDQMVKRFKELSAFMDLLRNPDDPRYDREKSDRQRLLDVRRHVQISALEVPPASGVWDPREYTMLGETSGGETQELVAFIIGSALRFRLGDQLRMRPRFAPVFLDEGFVKADAHFAGRAVQAWKGLGFQIIVSTPEDKVTGLERHMDQLLGITKDPATNYSYVHLVKDALVPGTDGLVSVR